EPAGGESERTGGLRALRIVVQLDRALGRWRTHRQLSRFVRVVVLRLASRRWRQARRRIHEQGHRRAAEAAVAAAAARARTAWRAALREADPLSGNGLVCRSRRQPGTPMRRATTGTWCPSPPHAICH